MLFRSAIMNPIHNRNKQERRRERGESEELLSSSSAGKAATGPAHILSQRAGHLGAALGKGPVADLARETHQVGAHRALRQHQGALGHQEDLDVGVDPSISATYQGQSIFDNVTQNISSFNFVRVFGWALSWVLRKQTKMSQNGLCIPGMRVPGARTSRVG